jgi:hypothetical protein
MTNATRAAEAAPVTNDDLPKVESQGTTDANPFDPAKLRVTSDNVPAVRKVLTVVPVRRPSRKEWFHVHPDPDYTLDVALYDDETENGTATYLVLPDMVYEFGFELGTRRLFTVVTRQKVVMLWPAKLPSDDSNLGRTWHESALQIAERAKVEWVRMSANRAANAYDLAVAPGNNMPGPEWPDMPFPKLLELAFRDRFIATADHPVLKQLRGEI